MAACLSVRVFVTIVRYGRFHRSIHIIQYPSKLRYVVSGLSFQNIEGWIKRRAVGQICPKRHGEKWATRSLTRSLRSAHPLAHSLHNAPLRCAALAPSLAPHPRSLRSLAHSTPSLAPLPRSLRSLVHSAPSLRSLVGTWQRMTVGTTSPTTTQLKLNGRGPCEPSLTSYYAHHSQFSNEKLSD